MIKPERPFEPILAFQEFPDLLEIKYPKFASWKIDGFRCIIRDGARTRELNSLVNDHVRQIMSVLPDGLDGEIVVGAPNEGDVFNRTQSGVSPRSGRPDFTYWVFDDFAAVTNEKAAIAMPFQDRYASAADKVAKLNLPWLKIVQHQLIHDADEAKSQMQAAIGAGYEGLILRDPFGRYKYGRSTLKEELLLKMKPFFDSEGVIVGYYEQMRNVNTVAISARGKAKRSTKKAGMVPAGTLGGVHVLWHNGTTKVTFDLAVGGTKGDADALWRIRSSLHGQLVGFTFQKLGKNGKPRHAVWKGLRLVNDVPEWHASLQREDGDCVASK